MTDYTYNSRTAIEDYTRGRTDTPPDTWVVGTVYTYASIQWVVLHKQDRPYSSIVVTLDDLNTDYVRV